MWWHVDRRRVRAEEPLTPPAPKKPVTRANRAALAALFLYLWLGVSVVGVVVEGLRPQPFSNLAWARRGLGGLPQAVPGPLPTTLDFRWR